jgi:hypothetical protein
MTGAIMIPQSTSYTFRLGPFIALSDVKTRLTGLTIAQADRRLSKAGAAYAQSNVSGSLTHSANGFYTCTLDTTDTNTLGALEMDVDIATSVVVRPSFQVVAADHFAAVNGSGNGIRANVNAINGVTSAALRLALSAGRLIPVTITNAGFTPTSTEFEFSDYSQAGTDQLKGRSMIFTSGSLIDVATRIETYSVAGGRGHVTVVGLNSAPASGVTALIV